MAHSRPGMGLHVDTTAHISYKFAFSALALLVWQQAEPSGLQKIE